MIIWIQYQGSTVLHLRNADVLRFRNAKVIRNLCAVTREAVTQQIGSWLEDAGYAFPARP